MPLTRPYLDVTGWHHVDTALDFDGNEVHVGDVVTSVSREVPYKKYVELRVLVLYTMPDDYWDFYRHDTYMSTAEKDFVYDGKGDHWFRINEKVKDFRKVPQPIDGPGYYSPWPHKIDNDKGVLYTSTLEFKKALDNHDISSADIASVIKSELLYVYKIGRQNPVFIGEYQNYKACEDICAELGIDKPLVPKERES